MELGAGESGLILRRFTMPNDELVEHRASTLGTGGV